MKNQEIIQKNPLQNLCITIYTKKRWSIQVKTFSHFLQEDRFVLIFLVLQISCQHKTHRPVLKSDKTKTFSFNNKKFSYSSHFSFKSQNNITVELFSAEKFSAIKENEFFVYGAFRGTKLDDFCWILGGNMREEICPLVVRYCDNFWSF